MYGYIIFLPFLNFAFIFVISLIINNIQKKKIIRIILVLYALIAVVNIIFIQKMKAFHTVTYALGCLLIVVVCIYYFLELFRNSKIG